MFLLVPSVEFGVVGGFICEHPEQDFQQALTQTSQCTGMSHALLTFLRVIGLAPSAGLAEAIRPQMDGVAHEFITGPAQPNLVDSAGLIGDRCGSCDSAEDLMIAIAIGVTAHGRQ